MKKTFKGIEVLASNKEWAGRTTHAKWLSGEMIALAESPEHLIKTYMHPAYCASEYKLKLNIFSFGKLKLHIPFTVIAPPVSVDKSGYQGDLDALIADYQSRKGLFLMLNLKAEELPTQSKVAMGKTLPSCIFENRFASFEDYLETLRSGYRRRIKIALQKSSALEVKTIDSTRFTEELYQLYLQVLQRSDFPLERLPIGFFRHCGCTIDVFYKENAPLAFVMYELEAEQMAFIFGGMDYAKRDCYDLYYTMLLHIVKVGIENNAKTINFGQTAETTKCRIGCRPEDRFMLAFGGNGFLTALLRLFAPLLENGKEIAQGNVFKG